MKKEFKVRFPGGRAESSESSGTTRESLRAAQNAPNPQNAEKPQVAPRSVACKIPSDEHGIFGVDGKNGDAALKRPEASEASKVSEVPETSVTSETAVTSEASKLPEDSTGASARVVFHTSEDAATRNALPSAGEVDRETIARAVLTTAGYVLPRTRGIAGRAR
ncbi:MAG: hypothetical protein LBL72_05740 [Candidatus Accumulibacter sp.]|jgi:hypothetical protein|nr:hypothetical protein [Accumulibacter sp.]